MFDLIGAVIPALSKKSAAAFNARQDMKVEFTQQWNKEAAARRALREAGINPDDHRDPYWNNIARARRIARTGGRDPGPQEQIDRSLRTPKNVAGGYMFEVNRLINNGLPVPKSRALNGASGLRDHRQEEPRWNRPPRGQMEDFRGGGRASLNRGPFQQNFPNRREMEGPQDRRSTHPQEQREGPRHSARNEATQYTPDGSARPRNASTHPDHAHQNGGASRQRSSLGSGSNARNGNNAGRGNNAGHESDPRNHGNPGPGNHSQHRNDPTRHASESSHRSQRSANHGNDNNNNERDASRSSNRSRISAQPVNNNERDRSQAANGSRHSQPRDTSKASGRSTSASSSASAAEINLKREEKPTQRFSGDVVRERPSRQRNEADQYHGGAQRHPKLDPIAE
ncbi:uncharacterized protein KY384_004025 [Bacidia gigantensis]|uniref:uncharacterized protein n=1 Tax=Bacidia gigantensis TaxID=2732470 RepID=UPI001D036E5E|nr:uncharacterized protein KY384_004025 [Bacidia gigantensis]KAG8530670.1 hypothetical protein KY384_004025 [Bacidia gigantensis]